MTEFTNEYFREMERVGEEYEKARAERRAEKEELIKKGDWDGAGLKADFKNTIIVMTSNLGLKESNELGFLSKEGAKSENAIREFFAPEFINRIDKILHFKDLSDESLEKIVQKELDTIAKNLKNISINADSRVKKHLVKKVQKKEFGARLLKRIVAEEISEKLSDEILFGRLKDGGVVKLRLKNNAIDFVF